MSRVLRTRSGGKHEDEAVLKKSGFLFSIFSRKANSSSYSSSLFFHIQERDVQY